MAEQRVEPAQTPMEFFLAAPLSTCVSIFLLFVYKPCLKMFLATFLSVTLSLWPLFTFLHHFLQFSCNFFCRFWFFFKLSKSSKSSNFFTHLMYLCGSPQYGTIFFSAFSAAFFSFFLLSLGFLPWLLVSSLVYLVTDILVCQM
jgi:hypothetical protein